MGAPHLFPPSTNLCYGKGTGPFPAYPANPDSNLLAADFANRKFIEINCEDLKIGPFPATCFYGDGSFYLLDTSGYWPGHLCALARTTPDTLIYLGGDICHFAGQFRPNEEIPLPDIMPIEALRRAPKYPIPCPGEYFSDHHPQLFNKEEPAPSSVDPRKTPFYKLSTAHHSTYKDPASAAITARGLQKYFDSDPNVLVCLAYDPALLDHLPLFNTHPERDLNDWKRLGLKERIHWSWLGELPRYNKDGTVLGPGNRERPIVEGFWRDGKRVKSFR